MWDGWKERLETPSSDMGPLDQAQQVGLAPRSGHVLSGNVPQFTSEHDTQIQAVLGKHHPYIMQ